MQSTTCWFSANTRREDRKNLLLRSEPTHATCHLRPSGMLHNSLWNVSVRVSYALTVLLFFIISFATMFLLLVVASGWPGMNTNRLSTTNPRSSWPWRSPMVPISHSSRLATKPCLHACRARLCDSVDGQYVNERQQRRTSWESQRLQWCVYSLFIRYCTNTKERVLPRY